MTSFHILSRLLEKNIRPLTHDHTLISLAIEAFRFGGGPLAACVYGCLVIRMFSGVTFIIMYL